MRPWTTRTLHVALLAAGVAALGSGTASAADLPGGTPEVPAAPAQLGGALPLALCQPPVPVQGQGMIPCADAGIGAQAPNIIKDGALTVAGTAQAAGQELQNGQPLADPHRVTDLAAIGARGATQLAAIDHQRPSANLGLNPGNTGLLDKGTLLDSALSPHQPGQPGFSAGDTQADLTALHGETLAPLTDPSRTVSELTAAPQTAVGNLTAGKSLPVAGDVGGSSAVSGLQNQLGQGVQQASQGAPVVGAVQRLVGQRSPKAAGLPELPLGQNNATPLNTPLGATGAVGPVLSQVTALTNGTGQPGAAGKHRVAERDTSSPVNQVPVLGQLVGQLNTPLTGGGNPLQSVGAPVNTGSGPLQNALNPAQSLTGAAQSAPAQTPAQPAQQKPSQAPTQALGNPTQALGNSSQAVQMVTGLVTGIAGSH